MTDMDLGTLNQLGHKSTDTRDDDLIDMRAIYSDDVTLAYNLCTQWSLFTHCETRLGNVPLNGALLGLSEVTIVLRRLLANKMCLLPELGPGDDGVRNPILHLACQHPQRVKPDSPHLIAAVESLRMDHNLYYNDPPFEDILHHRVMKDFWSMPRMRLFQPKMVFTPGEPPYPHIKMTTPVPGWEHGWARDMLIYNGDKSIQQFITETLGWGELVTPCCNFPDFIRVKYSARKLSDSSEAPGFNSVRHFTVSAIKLQECYANHPRMDVVVPSSYDVPYTLIACVFRRGVAHHYPAVRLYDLQGKAFHPATKSYNWMQRIGTAQTTCFLFYARCHRVEGGDSYPEISPLDEPAVVPDPPVNMPSLIKTQPASSKVLVSAAAENQGAVKRRRATPTPKSGSKARKPRGGNSSSTSQAMTPKTVPTNTQNTSPPSGAPLATEDTAVAYTQNTSSVTGAALMPENMAVTYTESTSSLLAETQTPGDVAAAYTENTSPFSLMPEDSMGAYTQNLSLLASERLTHAGTVSTAQETTREGLVSDTPDESESAPWEVEADTQWWAIAEKRTLNR